MLLLYVTIFLTGCANEPTAQPSAIPAPVLETFSFPSSKTSADISAAGTPRFKGSAKGKEKTLYLTFDDGPDPVGTTAVLKTLKKLNVKATFFVNGTHIQGKTGKNILKSMVKDGHTVSVHGWGHPDMTKLTTEQVRSELNKTKNIISCFLLANKNNYICFTNTFPITIFGHLTLKTNLTRFFSFTFI